MPAFNNTAFLCAYFSFNENADTDSILTSGGWSKVCHDKGSIETYKQFYYPGFIEFFMGGGEGTEVGKYTKKIEETISVGDANVIIKDIVIYMMPYGMALYSIHTEQESDNLDTFTLSLFKMREMRRWNMEELTNFHTKAIAPIEKTALSLGCRGGIIENGNKLKVFQIITAPDKSHFDNDTDTLLFELGTLGKVGGCSHDAPDSPSRSYIEQTVQGNRLSFFNNWKGLALFDTFTILGYDVKPWVRETWATDYFSMIYIHSLYCKFYLFKLNARFRDNPRQGEVLEKEYHDFERLYTFHRISYNFLPDEIDKAIDKALEITEEKKLLAGYISDYNKLHAEESSKRLNRLLTFLAIVTVFSTIWDFACMVNALLPFNEYAATVENGFRIVVSLTLLTVVVAIISMLKKPEKER